MLLEKEFSLLSESNSFLVFYPMEDNTLLLISNKQLKERSYSIPDDRYGMAALMNDHVRETMLSCPNSGDEKTVLVLAIRNQIVVGRALQLGSRLKLGSRIVTSSAGGGRVEVTPECRGKGVGTSIIKWRMNNDEYDFIIGALYSTMMLPLLKKQGFVIFEKPLFIRFHSFRPKLQSLGLRGTLLSIITAIANIPIKCSDFVNRIRALHLYRSFIILKEDIVPEWAGQMSTNDNHKYQEIHDQSWLQWNLDHNLNGYPQDIQSFYAIYDKYTHAPCGFFLTKERYEESSGHYRNVVKGTLCEWASIDSRLCEADILLLSLRTFTRSVYYVNAIATDANSIKPYKRMGFIRHGGFQVSFLDKKHQLGDDSYDVDNWRIRYGYANSIIC